MKPNVNDMIDSMTARLLPDNKNLSESSPKLMVTFDAVIDKVETIAYKQSMNTKVVCHLDGSNASSPGNLITVQLNEDELEGKNITQMFREGRLTVSLLLTETK